MSRLGPVMGAPTPGGRGGRLASGGVLGACRACPSSPGAKGLRMSHPVSVIDPQKTLDLDSHSTLDRVPARLKANPPASAQQLLAHSRRLPSRSGEFHGPPSCHRHASSTRHLSPARPLPHAAACRMRRWLLAPTLPAGAGPRRPQPECRAPCFANKLRLSPQWPATSHPTPPAATHCLRNLCATGESANAWAASDRMWPKTLQSPQTDQTVHGTATLS